MPVHDVHMDHTSAARNRGFHLLSQMREIGREYRGCQFDQNNVRRLGSIPERICGNSSTRGLKETLIKCGADTPVRVKASAMHNFPCWQIRVQSLPNQALNQKSVRKSKFKCLIYCGTPCTPHLGNGEWAGFYIDRQ